MKVYKLLMTTIALGLVFMSGETFGAAAPSPSQTVAEGSVTAKATFLNPKGADDPRFQVVLDAHSADLDPYDLKTIIFLRNDAGKSYVPIAAENKGSGHHREAIVSFPKISPESKRIELIIKDVAGVKERTFVWNLE